MLKYFLVILLFIACTMHGQSFFKTIPKIQDNQGFTFTIPDSTLDELRPMVEISAYGFPGGILLTGGGFSYQHLKLKKDRWKCVWSISYLTWYDLKKVFQGLTFGILNNNILIGIAAHSKEILGSVGIGLNFNN